MSGVYAGASAGFATAQINWATDSFGVMLTGPGYTPNLAVDVTLADVPSDDRLLTGPEPLTGTVVADGYCRADNLAWASLTTTKPIAGLAIVRWVDAAWHLVCFIDDGDGFGAQPVAAPLNIVFDTRGIFRP